MEGEEKDKAAGQGPNRNGRWETHPTSSDAAAPSCPHCLEADSFWLPPVAPQADQQVGVGGGREVSN